MRHDLRYTPNDPRPAPTEDLDKLPRALLAWPETLAKPSSPEGTPPGYGEDLWYGKTHTRTTRLIEYRLWNHANDIMLRVRATHDHKLAGIYGGRLGSKNGEVHTLPVCERYQALADRVVALCNHEMAAEGLVSPNVYDVMVYLKSMGTITRAPKDIERAATVTKPPMYEIAFKSAQYAAALVWYAGVNCSVTMTKWRPRQVDGTRFAKSRIGVREILGSIGGGKRLPWWDGLDDVARSRLANTIREKMIWALRTPPPWTWWAGTARRVDGWVRRGYTGSFEPVGVRSWDNTKRSGIKTVVRRFVRPSENQPQRELF